jgi:hypothetical protein
MALSKLSAAHKDPVRSLAKSLNDEERINSARTHNPDYPDIGWVLKTYHACPIGCRIAAPVAEKTKYLWFKFVMFHFAHSVDCHWSIVICQ